MNPISAFAVLIIERVHFLLASPLSLGYVLIERVQLNSAGGPRHVRRILLLQLPGHQHRAHRVDGTHLSRSGRIFLLHAFSGDQELADSVNRLLVVGFYLVNLGYVAHFLQTYNPLETLRQVIELESTKLGAVLLVLGIVHFFNILVLARMRRTSAGYRVPQRS